MLEYKGVVTTNVVAGTGLFSDFAAGLTDFFGGRSGTYKRQMSAIYDEAVEEISMKALQKGANAILGFRIDFDNLPDVGRIALVKGGILSKEKEKYICQHGHCSDKDAVFCETCDENIKGLTSRQVNKIESYRRKVESLKFLFQ